MLIEKDNKDFFTNYMKTTDVVLTGLIGDTQSFKSKAYFDIKNNYYLTTNYGRGEVITALQPYSIDLYNEIINEFSNVVSIAFIYDGYIGKESVSNIEKFSYLSYYYKFKEFKSETDKTDLPFIIRELSENDYELANQYDDLYLNFLPPKHGARMANQIKNYAEAMRDGRNRKYFALIDNIPVGHINAEYYLEYNACDFANIAIEEGYKQKGYGAAFLLEVTKENLKQGYDLYYTTVSTDNIASRKTAEKAGYIIAASCVSINLN